MKDFCRRNRHLLIAFTILISFIGSELLTSSIFLVPISFEKFEIDPSKKLDTEFRIIAKERYGVWLWIEKPKALDLATFNRLTGCPDLRNLSKGQVQGVTIPFRWTVQSSNERIVAQSSAAAITPPGNACSSGAGGGIISLEGFSIDPGRYHFKFQFSEEIPALQNFSARVYVNCCTKSGDTWLSSVLTFTNFLRPVFLLLAAILALALVVRAAMALYASRPIRAEQIKPL